MKLQNKKNGKIVVFIGADIRNDRVFFKLEDERGVFKREINSLSELNEEWEDYEEPKQDSLSVMILTLTNFIENEPTDNIDLQDCKKMLEKLKAWKLLKDECNIKFDSIIRDDRAQLEGVKLSYERHQVTFDKMRECMDALHLLFGGEE